MRNETYWYRNLTGSKEWVLLTGVYGPHIPGESRTFLQNLEKTRGPFLANPWIIGGDFNMITSLSEKVSEGRIWIWNILEI